MEVCPKRVNVLIFGNEPENETVIISLTHRTLDAQASVVGQHHSLARRACVTSGSYSGPVPQRAVLSHSQDSISLIDH